MDNADIYLSREDMLKLGLFTFGEESISYVKSNMNIQTPSLTCHRYAYPKAGAAE